MRQATGGIGPTHDDITTEAIAVAFGVPVVEHPEARARLQLHYGDKKLNAARLRMACVPEGATLIDNPVSAAPGFRIGNVHVLAGVPRIMEAMLDGLLGSLCVGAPRTTVTISGAMKEGDIAEALGGLALGHPTLEIGSYPWFRDGVIGTVLVVSGTDRTEVLRASDGIIALARAVGVEPDVR